MGYVYIIQGIEKWLENYLELYPVIKDSIGLRQLVDIEIITKTQVKMMNIAFICCLYTVLCLSFESD